MRTEADDDWPVPLWGGRGGVGPSWVSVKLFPSRERKMSNLWRYLRGQTVDFPGSTYCLPIEVEHF